MSAPTFELTKEVIIQAISKICSDANLKQNDLVFAAAADADLSCPHDTSGLFGIRSASLDASMLTTFYFAYSTWHGRVLYLDELGVPYSETEQVSFTVELIYKVLSLLAIELGCARFTWQHYARVKWPCHSPPETLEGWLTLHWNQESVQRFLGDKIANHEVTLRTSDISNVIQEILNGSTRRMINLKLATRNDIDDVERLIQGLADFENEPDAVKITRSQLLLDGFGEHPLYYCLLLQDVSSNNAPYTYGMAFCYFGYTKAAGRFLYLEDLYLEKEFRGKGAGTFVMEVIASISHKLRCFRLVWQALDWNIPALTFYKKLGAFVQNGLLTSRFANEGLRKYALEASELMKTNEC